MAQLPGAYAAAMSAAGESGRGNPGASVGQPTETYFR
jgi:hypothetical protein